jgi:hypothetical protein
MNLDILPGYSQGYIGICKDIVGYLDWISFLGYDLHSYPKSQKISFHILSYSYISLHILGGKLPDEEYKERVSCLKMLCSLTNANLMTY